MYPALEDMRKLAKDQSIKRSQENAEITRAILNGTERGAKRQAVCMNAGAALYIAGKTDTIEEGVRMAESLIDDGSALQKLTEFITESNS